ncbi:MAG: CDP-diacylglycerol--serine O-phosphatidyltransferase [Candidatus Latescibacterota bacterium]|nr:CDP-diacylglycerol--serine O-phosphatidyltransferase [Candidatus Latescibacterota bacterium]
MIHSGLIPSVITIGNLVCGFVALNYVMQGKYVPAAWLIVLAGTLDVLDGRIARFIGRDSKFGVELDSLADVCSFGVVPAVMFAHAFLPTVLSGALACVFLLCGALRLARYNVLSHTGEKSADIFLGLPIPAAAIILTQYIVFTEHAWETTHAASLGVALLAFVSFLMVSRIEYDSVPNFRSGRFWDRFKQVYFLVTVGLIIHPNTSKDFFFPVVMVYLLFGLCRWVIGMFSDEVTQHA